MKKTKEKLITIICQECKKSFIEKTKIIIGSEGTETTEIDVVCQHCGKLLTTKIEGKIRLDKISLRKFEGKLKKTNL